MVFFCLFNLNIAEFSFRKYFNFTIPVKEIYYLQIKQIILSSVQNSLLINISLTALLTRNPVVAISVYYNFFAWFSSVFLI